MTAIYKKNASNKTKIVGELRCIRCALERLLRVMDEGLFVDYQFEKFGRLKKGLQDELKKGL